MAPCSTMPRGRPRGRTWSPRTQTTTAMAAPRAARPGAPRLRESPLSRSAAVFTASLGLDGRLVVVPLARLEALTAVGGDVVAGLAVHRDRLGVPEDLLGVDDGGVLVGEGPGAERSRRAAGRGQGPAPRRQVRDVQGGTARLQLVVHGDELGVDGVAAQGEVLAAGRLVRELGDVERVVVPGRYGHVVDGLKVGLGDVHAALVAVVVGDVGGELAVRHLVGRVARPLGGAVGQALADVFGHVVGDALALLRPGPDVGVPALVPQLGEVGGSEGQVQPVALGALGEGLAHVHGVAGRQLDDAEGLYRAGDGIGVGARRVLALALSLRGAVALAVEVDQLHLAAEELEVLVEVGHQGVEDLALLGVTGVARLLVELVQGLGVGAAGVRRGAHGDGDGVSGDATDAVGPAVVAAVGGHARGGVLRELELTHAGLAGDAGARRARPDRGGGDGAAQRAGRRTAGPRRHGPGAGRGSPAAGRGP